MFGLFCGPLLAQVPVDSLPVSRDTLPPAVPADSVALDSTVVDLNGLRIGESLDDVLDYGAKDSMWFDIKNRQVHLYGQAFVNYLTLRIVAGHIRLDYVSNEVSAEPYPDSSGQLAGRPDFKDGEQNFTAERLRYNFKTRKGIIYEARTRQEDLYVLGEKAKFIGAPDAADSTAENRLQNVIYNRDALITTCDAPHPHYGIRTKKLKVVPDKVVVTGVSALEVSGVPTPLILPFGFFPISKTRKAGLIIPRDFEFAEREGLGIKDFGWYQPLNDHLDLITRFNIYTSGSYGALGQLRYEQRYRYRGDFQINFNNRVFEDQFAQNVSNKSFGLRWTHDQDQKAHPTRKFGGSVNIETNRDANRNRNDYQSVYQNTLRSNINYSQSFPGTPFNLTGGFSHTQNTQTRIMSITLPDVRLTMQRIYPFKRKEPIGKEQWYEKISLTYNSQLRNSVQIADTLLFTDTVLQAARIGVQHTASSDYSFKLFKYINVLPNINYEENWYPSITDKEFVDEIKLHYDTLYLPDSIPFYVVDSSRSEFGRVESRQDYGFNLGTHTYRTFTAGISTNTALFFTRQFRQGWLRGFRHKITPSASISFGPDFSSSQYFRTVQTSNQPGRRDSLNYSIFEDAIFGRPSTGPREVAISYSLGNLLELKHFSRRDTTERQEKKIRIFDNLAFSGFYSLTADSLKWSEVRTGGLFRLFKGVSTLTWNATFDPYIADERGQRINRFVVNEKGRLLRTSRLGIQLNTSFRISELRNRISNRGDARGEQPASTPRAPATISDDFLGWIGDFNVVHRISYERQLIPTGVGTSRDTFVIGTNSLSVNGSIPLSSKWRINLNNISYDFKSNSLVYPDLGFTRDLHCWELSLSWQPVRGTYLFSLNVKPGSLDFLKIPYRKNNADARLSF